MPPTGRRTPTGKWGRTLDGHLAFLPNPLPPPLEWKPRLVNALANLLGGNPFITARGAEKKLKVAYNTVVRAIDQLEAAGIVREISEAKRHRVWCAKVPLDILEQPARLEVWEPESPTPPR